MTDATGTQDFDRGGSRWQALRSRLIALVRNRSFRSSGSYWQERYDSGGNSGPGSYGRLAQYKAEYLNSFVEENQVTSVVELGSGDGNQLTLARYPEYLGIDISADAVDRCRKEFGSDRSKNFIAIQPGGLGTAASLLRRELALSLDVIYHLVEDEIYDEYMKNLFDLGSRYVIIYSSNSDDNSGHSFAHVKNRRFTDWIAMNRPEQWSLSEHTENPYGIGKNLNETSISDFFVFERRSTATHE